ncbi:helix-turn-helix domain-containing protein [Paraburkholderia diazotrophica]|uniref:helix-turn-helix domain-containing protein n=1 Tax=Paraburkholderia diazotrophica TaxID=667676 RepID=UPI00316CCBBD
MIAVRENGPVRERSFALKRTIAVVLSEGCDLLGIGILAEAFERANELSRQNISSGVLYETLSLSAKGGYVHCSRSLSVSTKALAEFMDRRIDRIFVARGPNADSACQNVVQSSWLQAMRSNGTIIRFLPACVISDPRSEPALSPGKLERAILATSDDRLSSTIHAAFDVIRFDLGEALAQEAIRYALGDKEIVVTTDASGDPVDRVRLAARWIRENCHRPLTVVDAADACAMSERSLLRHFRAYLGTSPSEYLQRTRLELACEMLATTSLPADKIARRVGLGSGDRLGKLLRRLKGITTTEYRAAACERTEGRADDERCNRGAPPDCRSLAAPSATPPAYPSPGRHPEEIFPASF